MCSRARHPHLANDGSNNGLPARQGGQVGRRRRRIERRRSRGIELSPSGRETISLFSLRSQSKKNLKKSKEL